jgi:hypothetical protein
LHAFGACNTIITALISKRYLIFSSVSVRFKAPKAELAAELTDSLDNIRYLFEINAVIMV